MELSYSELRGSIVYVVLSLCLISCGSTRMNVKAIDQEMQDKYEAIFYREEVAGGSGTILRYYLRDSDAGRMFLMVAIPGPGLESDFVLNPIEVTNSESIKKSKVEILNQEILDTPKPLEP